MADEVAARDDGAIIVALDVKSLDLTADIIADHTGL